jgi:tetratricopeptide (TPR) repeat protein
VERDRLQSLAGVQRTRGQITDARETLEKVLLLSEGMKPREIAPVHEQIGDLLLTEEKLDEAVASFKKAYEIDPTRVSAEKKFANTTLRISDSKAENRLNEAMMRGDGIGDLLADSARYGRRNAGFAMLLSLVVPGFGQFYNGQFRKGVLLLGIFALALLIISVSPDGKDLMDSFARIVSMKPLGRSGNVSLLTITMAILAFGTWLYSLVDAPYYAGKVNTESVPGGPVDKSGWEV